MLANLSSFTATVTSEDQLPACKQGQLLPCGERVKHEQIMLSKWLCLQEICYDP